MRKNVVVTCGGKWAGIVVQIRNAMMRIPDLRDGKLIVTSSDAFTAAGCFADLAFQVPRVDSPEYIRSLQKICEENSVRIVIPLIDLDVQVLCRERRAFAEIGSSIVCPEPDVFDLCFDKLAFASFAIEAGLPHPRTFVLDDASASDFPAFYKRRQGFGSINSGFCEDLGTAVKLASKTPDLLFQDIVKAPEITVDAYISREGRCTVCVPRIRQKVVAGEAYQTQTIDSLQAAQLARATIRELSNRGLRGPLNVQMFDARPMTLLEVNTRLGSASVLSNRATDGRFFEGMLAEAIGGTANGEPEDYVRGLSLVRFLGDIFHRDSAIDMVIPGAASR